jgi:hypothetical protein
VPVVLLLLRKVYSHTSSIYIYILFSESRRTIHELLLMCDRAHEIAGGSWELLPGGGGVKVQVVEIILMGQAAYT